VTVEREILISTLMLTRESSVKIEEVSRKSRIPVPIVREMLKKNSDRGIVQLDGETVRVEAEQRLKAAVRVMELGADVERVCKVLTWTEFEDFAFLAFEANNFVAKKHFRFNWSGRRWEIDILALKEPIVASVDCKQWHRGWGESANRKAAELQVERTQVLAEASSSMSDKIGVTEWKHAYFVPIIISLMQGPYKLYGGTPVVPILQLRDFLQGILVYIDKITHFHVHFPSP